ncbi:formin-like protein 3 [Iris pallida]|uniref:Formin-like protein 3 n=1 Tax=Iris pallida TaxID=29817 RepID=A0AAX6I8N6_IRIPA|nr:formin-like protein 3 [Iris pallida]
MGCGGGAMEMRKKRLLVVLMVVLASASLLRFSGERLVVVGSEAIASSGDLLEQIIPKRSLNPADMQSVVRNIDFSILHGIVTDSSDTKLNRKFVIEGSHEKGQSTLPNCQNKHILLHVSGEDIHRNQYSEYLASLFGWDTLPRRHLADQANGVMAPTLAPSPAPAPAPVSVLSLDHGVESPSYSPPPSSFRDLSGPSPSPTFNDEFSGGSDSPSLPPQKHKKSKSSVAITVVLTAAGATVLVALLFCCCKRCLRNDGDDKLKDERPLLALSMSDFSGSSHKSGVLDAAIQKDKIESLSLKLESSRNGHIVNLDGCGETPASKIPSGIPTSSNELPNASSNDIASVLPPLLPLKPPPGRKVASTPPSPPAASPPPPPKPKPGPPPPPPPKSAPLPPKAAPPRPPQAFSKVPHPSPHRSSDESSDAHAPKTKLKPLFWDKVSTSPERSMVWNEIKSGSFQFNEEMIETLFGYRSDDKGKNENKKASSSHDPPQYIQLLEPKKSQNLAISLKAMSVKVDEFRDALIEGNELPAELLQTLLRMTPTTDEELKLRLYTGEPYLLGPGEQFLKAIMDIPFAFKRMDSLLFMTSLQEDVSSIKESFALKW